MSLTAKCQNCGERITIRREGGAWVTSPCACDRPEGAPRPAPVPSLPRTAAEQVAVRQALRSPHGTAVRTDCDCGRRHASRGEARVCAEVRRRFPRVLQQVRFPLLGLGGGARGDASYLTVDFVVFPFAPAGPWEAVDAKAPGAPRSREWRRGTEAFLAEWGRPVREAWVDGRGQWTCEWGPTAPGGVPFDA